MSPKELTAFRMSPELIEAMRAYRDAHGVPMAKQIDFAMRAWLASKGVTVKAARKRAVPRKRA